MRQVNLSQGHPLSRSHLKISRWPLEAAEEHTCRISPSDGDAFMCQKSHFMTLMRPSLAAESKPSRVSWARNNLQRALASPGETP
jgi:hypothetical protein